MTDPALQVQVDAANAYESFFVPALFREWPARMIGATGLREGQRVLDVACGTGVLTRAVAARVGTGGAVTGIDINPGMLSVARRMAPPWVEFHESPAESLPFPGESFDVVTCQFGLMFFGDRDRALREMLRVLVPGGRLAVAVWDSLDNQPAYSAEVALLRRLGGERAAEALRAPFVLGDRELLAQLFQSAGATSVVIDTHFGTARFPSIRSIVEADLRGWLPVFGVSLPEDTIQQVLQEAEQAMRPYVTQKGGITFDAPGHIVVARRP